MDRGNEPEREGGEMRTADLVVLVVTASFEGFQGTGTYKGERVGSLKTGADTYIDASFNCKKP